MAASEFTSRLVRAGGFLVSEAEPFRSREAITVLAGEVLVSGHVLGRVTVGESSSAAKAGGNTGGGTITAEPTLEDDVIGGVYVIRCIGGTFSVARTADPGNIGDGVMTLATPAFGAGVVAGTYRAVCVIEGVDGGSFTVFDPAGDVVGLATVGVAFDDVVKFTIADGATDFDINDSIEIVVSDAVAANGGVFSVVSPAGVPLPNATEGVAYTTQIGFQIDDVGTDFIVGDGFDVTVILGIGKYREYDPTNTDGSGVARGILWDDADATAADVNGVAVLRSCEVNAEELTWFTGATAQQKTDALAVLADGPQIIARAAI